MKQITGNILKQMIISGANNLYNHYPEIDALNVFPVPDGDTGTNMNLTVASGAKEIQNRVDDDCYQIAKAFSRGLLMGARGNSGVITSQIFGGFAKSLEGKNVIRPMDLAAAFVRGKDVAYKAVMKPVEGTILTVIREASTALMEQVTPNTSIEKCFDILLKEARASLKRTPDLLPVLKEVGVVDSGATGLIKILEGFQSAILGKIVERQQATAFDDEKSAAGSAESDEFGYCTEFILRLDDGNNPDKKVFVEKRFTSVLSSHGNSLVVVHEQDIVKVHVHTLLPGYILQYAQQFGEFVTLKIENMTEQHTKLEEKNGASEPKPQEKKKFAIISCCAGDGIEAMFKDLRVDEIVSGGQTMNPSTEDFVTAIQHVNAENIILLPNNGNIILAASQAAEMLKDEKHVYVIPSKTIPQGLVACMMFNPEGEVKENVEEMTNALSSIKSGQVTFAIKDTSFNGIDIKKDNFMGICDKEIICCHEDKFEVAFQLIESMIDEMSSIVTLIAGEDVTEEEMNALVTRITEAHEDIDVDAHIGKQPVYSFIVGVE